MTTKQHKVTGKRLEISLEALYDKLHIMGEAGSGKSRFMGRELCWKLFGRQWPQVILDPTGGTIDNFLDKALRESIRVGLPRDKQERLWSQIVYVDMSGKGGHVVPFPLYYRLDSRESLFGISQRFLEIVRRMDVHLSNAPIMGLNALATVSTYASMLLHVLGCQITEAESLVRRPEAWAGRLERALSLNPEVRPAVEFFRAFGNMKPNERSNQAKTFLVKIMPFIAEPSTRAMFSASGPGLQWSELVKNGVTVLLDFRGELNPELRRFKLLWCFRSLIDYAKLRGTAGRSKPFGFIIDELTQLLGFGEAGDNSIMAEDIEELISVVSRNYGVFPLCIAHQNLPQLSSERIQKAVMTMGTQMIGVQSDPESAELLGQTLVRYDPYWVKRYDPVWMTVMYAPTVVDYRPVDFTPEEQTLLNSYRFRDLKRFQFIVQPALGEGNKGNKVNKVSIENLDQGVYPEAKVIDRIRERLMQRDGRPVNEVLAEINARQSSILSKPPAKIGSSQGPEIELLEIVPQ